MNLEDIETDYNKYMVLLERSIELDEKFKMKNNNLESYHRKGEISEVRYNSRKYKNHDGKSYHWVMSYGTEEEKQYFEDIIDKIREEALGPIRQEREPVEKEMEKITDKYYPIYRNHYIGFPEGNDHEAFLETIMNSVKVIKGELVVKYGNSCMRRQQVGTYGDGSPNMIYSCRKEIITDVPLEKYTCEKCGFENISGEYGNHEILI